jgi:hypothetical protein
MERLNVVLSHQAGKASVPILQATTAADAKVTQEWEDVWSLQQALD